MPPNDDDDGRLLPRHDHPHQSGSSNRPIVRNPLHDFPEKKGMNGGGSRNAVMVRPTVAAVVDAGGRGGGSKAGRDHLKDIF